MISICPRQYASKLAHTFPNGIQGVKHSSRSGKGTPSGKWRHELSGSPGHRWSFASSICIVGTPKAKTSVQGQQNIENMTETSSTNSIAFGFSGGLML